MMWLALWCAIGAAVGWAVGTFTGRPATGAILGTFAGPFGWLLLLGANPRTRAVGEHADLPSPDEPVAVARVEHADVVEAPAPKPISWAASA